MSAAQTPGSEASAADLPPFPPERLVAAPFPERVRLACLTWASQVNPNPFIVVLLYWAKYWGLYVGGWACFVALNDAPAGAGWVERAFATVSFQKAIAWSIFYELSGMGCSWGPMNARFKPMIGGFRHFLRPGTTKLPLVPGLPLFGGIQRTPLDVALYALNQLLLLRVLLAPEVTPDLLLPAFVLIPLLGLSDKTLFLAARSEHYYVALVCLVVASAGDLWISGCKVLWSFIWFWAATSKVNHHFPSVIMFMMNNGPFFPTFLKKRLFAHYPDDLRPSRLAAFMAHMGTLTEYSIPVLLLASPNATFTAVVLCLMVGFHGFIALNNPNGMPIEWNILMIYGGIFLFGFHPEAGVLAVGAMPGLVLFLAFCLVVVPTFGNLVPSRVSFLLSMRYYAGNWAYNVWLVRKSALAKLDALKKSSGTMREQLTEMLDDPAAAEAALAMSLASRFMHLEGRPLFDALPHAIDAGDDIDDYEWMDGEIFGGMVLGWNFGDGHLNHGQLLDAVQAQCGFDAGELRVVMVESQPFFGRSMHWRVVDAARGELAAGDSAIDAHARSLQPWPTGAAADALLRPPRNAPA